MKKSGHKWKTNKCGRCGEAHRGYSGKLDKNNIEYVVCGKTNKRMDVSWIGEGREMTECAFRTLGKGIEKCQTLKISEKC